MSEIERAANPTIEEAIKYLEGMIFTQDFHPSTLRAKAVNTMAIAALREQAERSRGCEYCAKSDKVYLTRDVYTVIGNEGPYISSDEGYTCAEIGFCPSCGKRLEVEP